ncbi:MAG: trypsin-like peptidase domain-containing protein, partial [Armatimonadota bacterium]|nr:trypsin-like peptidase domain-containing protein [Armatimonadota bacterium]
MTPRSRLLALTIVLFASTSWRFAHPASPVIQRAKQATALVELPGDEGFGSAFCITPTGLFVTNQHVVEDFAVGDKVSLVMNAGERDQKVLPAKVLRIDDEHDLALLQAETNTPLATLPLGDVAGLAETLPVAAIGFPFGADLALEENQYPSATVTVGRITALRRSQGELREIQIDAAINPGNSGGPLINEKGEVIGVVFATIAGAEGINFAIPVSLLSKMLSTPEVIFRPDPIPFAKRQEEQEFRIRLVPIMRSPTPLTVELMLSATKGDQRTFAAQPRGNDEYVVRAVPIPPGGPAATAVGYNVVVRQAGQIVNQTKGLIDIVGAVGAATPNVATPGFGSTGAAATGGGAPKPGGDWLGSAASSSIQSGVGGASAASDTNRMLLKAALSIDDLQVHPVDLKASDLIANLLWSVDGKYLYALEKTGVLHKITVPDFK